MESKTRKNKQAKQKINTKWKKKTTKKKNNKKRKKKNPTHKTPKQKQKMGENAKYKVGTAILCVHVC